MRLASFGTCKLLAAVVATGNGFLWLDCVVVKVRQMTGDGVEVGEALVAVQNWTWDDF